jgi:phage gp46-like protein
MAEFGNNYNFGDSPLFKDEGWEEWPPESFEEPDSEGDIRLIPGLNETDIAVADRDLERDSSLETAIIISLFTDKRARTDDITPDRNEDRRGWYGDSLNIDGDADGSWLWLLYRSKTTAEIPALAKEYTEDALRWLLEDGVAERVVVSAVRADWNTLIITARVYRPGAVQPELFRYFYNWQAQIYKGI